MPIAVEQAPQPVGPRGRPDSSVALWGVSRPRVPAPVLVLLLLLLAGCSSYEQRWQEGLERTPEAAGLEGCWEGTWTSEVNGHTGGLRAVVSSLGQGRHRIDYHATYTLGFVPLSFRYSTEVQEESSERGVAFTGSADLGWLAGGEYRYDGRVVADRFTCRYEASSDRGIFELERVAPELSAEW